MREALACFGTTNAAPFTRTPATAVRDGLARVGGFNGVREHHSAAKADADLSVLEERARDQDPSSKPKSGTSARASRSYAKRVMVATSCVSNTEPMSREGTECVLRPK